MEDKSKALPTQDFVEVAKIHQGAAILKNGSLRQVVMVSGVNFDLKSEAEQEALVFAYQNFLNSLDFPLQIFVHSRKINIDRYLKGLAQMELQEPSPLLRTQIAEYKEFVRTLVSENIIMHKSFYVVVPYDPIQLPKAGKKASKKFFRFLSKDKVDPQIKGEDDLAGFEEYLSQLSQRTQQVVAGINQMGLRAVALNQEESIELFYNLYNPEAIEKKGLEISKSKK